MIELIILLMLISITIGLIMLCIAVLNMLEPGRENPIRLATAFFSVLFVLEMVTLFLVL